MVRSEVKEEGMFLRGGRGSGSRMMRFLGEEWRSERMVGDEKRWGKRRSEMWKVG